VTPLQLEEAFARAPSPDCVAYLVCRLAELTRADLASGGNSASEYLTMITNRALVDRALLATAAFIGANTPGEGLRAATRTAVESLNDTA